MKIGNTPVQKSDTPVQKSDTLAKVVLKKVDEDLDSAVEYAKQNPQVAAQPVQKSDTPVQKSDTLAKVVLKKVDEDLDSAVEYAKQNPQVAAQLLSPTPSLLSPTFTNSTTPKFSNLQTHPTSTAPTLSRVILSKVD